MKKTIAVILLATAIILCSCGKVKEYPTSTLMLSAGGTDNSTYPFEDAGGLAGFSIIDVPTNRRFLSMSFSTEQAYKGSGSVKIACNFNAGNSGGVISRSGTNMPMAGKTITAYVWVPYGMFPLSLVYGTSIFVQIANFNWYDSGWKNLTPASAIVPGMWNKISAKVDDMIFNGKNFAGNGDNANTAIIWGIKVGQGGSSPNYTGDIYIDSITVE